MFESCWAHQIPSQIRHLAVLTPLVSEQKVNNLTT